MIYGGSHEIKNGIIYNTDSKDASKIIKDTGFNLWGFSPGQLTSEHSCISLIHDRSSYEIKFIEFDKRTLSFSTIKNLGKSYK